MSKRLQYRYNSFGDLACVIEYVLKTTRPDIWADKSDDERKTLALAIAEAIVSPTLIEPRPAGNYI